MSMIHDEKMEMHAPILNVLVTSELRAMFNHLVQTLKHSLTLGVRKK